MFCDRERLADSRWLIPNPLSCCLQHFIRFMSRERQIFYAAVWHDQPDVNVGIGLGVPVAPSHMNVRNVRSAAIDIHNLRFLG